MTRLSVVPVTSLASTSPAWLLRSWSSGCLAKSELLRQDGQGRGKVGDCAVTDATWPQSLTASTEAAGSSQLGALVAAASLMNTVKLICLCFPPRSHRSRHRAQGSLEIRLNDYGTVPKGHHTNKMWPLAWLGTSQQ